MDSPRVRLHARVFGLVQGVNFRYSTREYAQRLGLTGWVCNLPDGSVEVLAEGPQSAVEPLLEYLHRGPRHAAVEQVQAEWLAATGEFMRFDIRL